MKKKRIITMFLGILFLLNISHVKAETTPIIILGKTSVLLGEEQTAIVKLATEEKVGIISGKIQYSSEINDIVLKGLSGWSATYNSDTKEFNIYKAEGAQEETIMEIIYTAGETEGKGQIVLSDIQMTTINYETIQVPSEVVKEIEVKSDRSEEDDNTDSDLEEENDEEDDDDNSNPEEDNIKDDKEDNSDNSDNQEEDKNLESNEKNSIDKDKQQKEDDNTIKKSILPKAGLVQKIFLIAGPILAIATLACYRTYKKYKGI